MDWCIDGLSKLCSCGRYANAQLPSAHSISRITESSASFSIFIFCNKVEANGDGMDAFVIKKVHTKSAY